MSDRNGMPAVETAARSNQCAAIGLRNPHLAEIIETRPNLGWLEVHSENYLLPPNAPRSVDLARIREDYDLSCHGVGLSIGSAAGLDRAHLNSLCELYDRLEPVMVSEHLAWSVVGSHYYNDLLPVPYSDEALNVVCRNIDLVQERLRRRLLIENPARYLMLPGSDWPEAAFLSEMIRRTGCGLLFDVNNLFVSAHNLQLDMGSYLWDLPIEAISEVHVAGHSSRESPSSTGAREILLIDDHGSAVPQPVWALLEGLLSMTGPLPVLVEWDTNVPPLAELLAEAAMAQQLIDAVGQSGSGDAAASCAVQVTHAA